MPGARRRLLVRLPQALQTVLPQRLQQPIPGCSAAAPVHLHLHERPIDQARDEVQNVSPLTPSLCLVGAHRLGRGQGKAAGEDREPAQQGTLDFRQERVAPIDGRPQRLVARQRGRAVTGQEAKSIVQAGRQLVD